MEASEHLRAVQLGAMLPFGGSRGREPGHSVGMCVERLLESLEQALAADVGGIDGAVERGLDLAMQAAGLLVGIDPGRHDAGVVEHVERQCCVPGIGVVLEGEWATAGRQIVEDASFLALADQSFAE